MAKPTEEILTLPTFSVSLVKHESSELVASDITLHDFHQQLNKGLIVYFYPRDNTSGCTTQAQDFTAMHEEFDTLGYAIVGVSRDSIDSHKKFMTSKELTVDLISDVDEKLCQHFDVIKEKNMYGKKTLGLVRSTFVFDKAGTLTHAQRNLRAKGYAQRLIDILS